MKLFMTAKDSKFRLTEKNDLVKPKADHYQVIVVDPTVKYQEILGFGGAFTEAAAVTLGKLGNRNQEEVIRSYFDQNEGNGYTLCRTHINSCDFSLGNYAYSEVNDDIDLKHFTIDRDRKTLIPMIKKSLAVTEGRLKLFASPWSPPAWMKSNGKMNDGGKLLPQYHDAWARYYARYIKEYAKEGVAIWGVTVQNEPEAVQRWDSCIYTAEEERDFVRDHLGPCLAKEGLSHVNIMIWDHNRDRMFYRAKVALDDPAAAAFIWGVAFHWYVGDNFNNVRLVHDKYPQKHLLFSEGCQEGGPHAREWQVGERYGRSILRDLNNWTEAWVDWNLLLDETGGPNHVQNYCSAPIIADTVHDSLLYQASYYYIGHFSRFVKPGARRILCSSSNDNLETAAFINKNESIACVLMNSSDTPYEYNMMVDKTTISCTIPAHGIETIVL